MAKRKEIPLLKHFQDPAFRDSPPSLTFPGAVDRLSTTHVCDPGGWREVAQIIATSVRFRTAWFPDANVAILNDAAPVWDAMRLAALGSGDSVAVFTAVVRHELREWLEQPYRHAARAEAIRNALADGTWGRKFGLEADSLILPAIFGYMRLLGLRRYLALPTPDGRTMVGTDPENQSDTMNAIATKVGSRAQGLAKKGRIDADKNREINLDDELHCLLAIAHSLLTGRESVILTADKDFIEIFWKAQWIFDTHYRAYLAAPLLKAGAYGAPVTVLENTDGYFDGPLTVYRRHTTHMREVLPRFHRSVPVSVVYVSPERLIHKIGFKFEREMLGMLEMRSKTHGRCTDLFGDENIHIDLGPIQVDLDGTHVGVGRDVGYLVQTNHTKSLISRVDAEHILSCRERFTLRTATRA